MEHTSAYGRLPFDLDLVLRRGLGRTLLFCFLGLCAVPVILVGFIGCQTACNLLEQQVRQNIRMAATMKGHQLQVLFDSRGREPATASFFSAANRMLGAPMELGVGSRAYLVGPDLKLMAGMAGKLPPDDGFTVDTAQTRLWREHLAAKSSGPLLPEPFTYAGPDGGPVMGTCAKIHLGSTPYALIVEVETKAALGGVHRFRAMAVTLLILTGAGMLMASAALARMIAAPLRDLSESTKMAANGRLDPGIPVTANNEIGDLAAAFNGMVNQLKAARTENDARALFMSRLAILHRLIGGEQELGELYLNTLEFLSSVLDLSQADFFIVDGDKGLTCAGRFPGHPGDTDRGRFSPQQGRVGQAAAAKGITAFRRDPASASVRAVSTADQANLIAVPIVLCQTVKGVLELETTGVFTPFDCRFVEAAAEVIAVAVNSASIRKQEHALFKQTQEQAGKLKVREAELEQSNREMLAQSRAFQASEKRLQFKQLELEAANAQMVKNAAALEAHMAILEAQKLDMEKQNAELENTHRELAENARQLERSSRYKTEFMANMSHELRTPLNSILLLSRLLQENREQTLTTRQIEFAHTIQSAGEDLLHLINDILDLARVESGKMEVEFAPVRVRSIADAMQVSFAPMAEQSGVGFAVHVAPDVPETLITDRKRIEQILKNFLSNAFKFTTRGTVRVEFAVSRKRAGFRNADDGHGSGRLAIAVVDTGIGIPAVKHRAVFEAFQQVDGSIRRKYGGTGLGLSISRELARLLGGEITMESMEGRGSRFTLHLPVTPVPDKAPTEDRSDALRTPFVETVEPAPRADGGDPVQEMVPVPDDRNKLAPGDKSILIMDTDAGNTEAIKDCAYRNGYKVLVAEGVQTGLHFADYYLPAAVFLNLRLPGSNGWAMVRRIKANPRVRHIPVFTLSPRKEDFMAAVYGAAGHMAEPVTSRGLETAFRRIQELRASDRRRVLVVAPDPEGTARISNAVGGKNIRLVSVPTAAGAGAVLESNPVDAVILHPALSAAEQHCFFKAFQKDPRPVFLYPGPSPAARFRTSVSQYEKTVNLKEAGTPDQLLLALAVSLHLPPETLDPAHRDRLRNFDKPQAVLKGRNVLLVDDDMRTVFAVSSILEDQGAKVLAGKTGKESLDKLDGFPDIDLILMDVMISGVDGYRSIREIRNRDRYASLPIITLTAKAMKGDRAKCIAAGADDYLAKPVNPDKLTSMLKIWLDPQLAAPEYPGA